MQKLIIGGMITKDAELRRTQNGDPVCGFSLVADNGKDKDGNRRDGTFYDCSIFGKRAENVYRYLVKGLYLIVEGRPDARVYNDKAYLQCRVSDFTFQGTSGGNTGKNAPQEQSEGYGGGAGADMDEQIPF